MVLRVVERGWSISEAAAAAEVSDRTCSKWVARYRAEGEVGLRDRSSAPQRGGQSHRSERTEQLLAALRRLRFTAPELAELLDMPLLDGLGACSSGLGWASSAGSGWSPRAATSASGPAS